MTKRVKPGLVFASLGGGVVVISIFVGLSLVGGPSAARDYEADENTRNRMMGVFNSVDCYYKAFRRLPKGLGDLRTSLREEVLREDGLKCAQRTDTIRALTISDDPDITVTKTSDTTFEICGVFRRGLPLTGAGDIRRNKFATQTEPGGFCIDYNSLEEV